MHCPDSSSTMIHPSHSVNIYIATKAVDVHKGHDGSAGLVQGHLRKTAFDGGVSVVCAKRGDRLKLIDWYGSGLVMADKRLERHAENVNQRGSHET